VGAGLEALRWVHSSYALLKYKHFTYPNKNWYLSGTLSHGRWKSNGLLGKMIFSAVPCGDKEEIQRDVGIFNGISVRVGTTKLSLAAGWATARAVSRVITLPVGFPCTPPTAFSVSWPLICHYTLVLILVHLIGKFL